MSPHRERMEVFRSWTFIAARDGAMSIYHFAKAMDGANTWAFRSKCFAAKIDKSGLSDAFKLLRTHFPKFEAVRNAVAHAADVTKNPKWLSEHILMGPFEKPLLKLDDTSKAMIKNTIFNDVFMSTFDSAIQEYEVSIKTLNALIEIKNTFYKAFPTMQ